MISWDSLKSRIAAAITLYEMRQAHQEYLATIHERCFLLPKVQIIIYRLNTSVLISSVASSHSKIDSPTL